MTRPKRVLLSTPRFSRPQRTDLSLWLLKFGAVSCYIARNILPSLRVKYPLVANPSNKYRLPKIPWPYPSSVNAELLAWYRGLPISINKWLMTLLTSDCKVMRNLRRSSWLTTRLIASQKDYTPWSLIYTTKTHRFWDLSRWIKLQEREADHLLASNTTGPNNWWWTIPIFVFGRGA